MLQAVIPKEAQKRVKGAQEASSEPRTKVAITTTVSIDNGGCPHASISRQKSQQRQLLALTMVTVQDEPCTNEWRSRCRLYLRSLHSDTCPNMQHYWTTPSLQCTLTAIDVGDRGCNACSNMYHWPLQIHTHRRGNVCELCLQKNQSRQYCAGQHKHSRPNECASSCIFSGAVAHSAQVGSVDEHCGVLLRELPSTVAKHCWAASHELPSTVAKHCWAALHELPSTVAKHCWVVLPELPSTGGLCLIARLPKDDK
eukprot:1161805-Pelagomonas_calceolata.AAC.5